MNAQALPGESLVVGKPFRADYWWEEVERSTEVGGLNLPSFCVFICPDRCGAIPQK